MELALYAPGLGYYMAGARKLGADGDFVTAPEISPLYGKTLARQVAQVLDASHPEVLEVGAGSGALAAELLAELEALGRAARALSDPRALPRPEKPQPGYAGGARAPPARARRLAQSVTALVSRLHHRQRSARRDAGASHRPKSRSDTWKCFVHRGDGGRAFSERDDAVSGELQAAAERLQLPDDDYRTEVQLVRVRVYPQPRGHARKGRSALRGLRLSAPRVPSSATQPRHAHVPLPASCA